MVIVKKVENSIGKLSENLRQSIQINQKDTNEIILEAKRRTEVSFFNTKRISREDASKLVLITIAVERA